MTDRVYLDHAATTAVLPAVVERVAQQMGVLGNASSLHTAGRAARRVVEESREAIAAALGARPSEVIFTSGGTEADNLAVAGTYRRRREDDPRRTRLLVSAIEHHAVLDCVEHLVRHEGAEVTWLGVDEQGRVDPATVRAALEEAPDDVAVVSVMWANNEVGTVQPVRDIAAIAREFAVPFHTDAVQAIGQVPVDFAESGADLLALTGHKIGGPLGVGVLLARRDVKIQPLSYGGGQERQVRSGTLDTPAIAGLAMAVEHAVTHLEEHAAHLASLRDKLIHGAVGAGFGITVTGPHDVGDVVRRLPGTAHLRVPGCEGDSLLYLLDAAGVECSTGSACQAGVPQPSHVLLAMGISEDDARGALRLSLGHTSTDSDVEAFLTALPAAVERAQRAHHATRGSER
ncbi:cysteine desulfurase family protein [Luteipulveratus mongoliensis]|uniref:Cysteine desulfurase n=1 Tax=Luteipulveratus mongoliensis TaxID=571913 RepID=A0A0K1JLK7_9MICO|nr:cysteine desulfurase family protein [Luteipulveratus mongoliensis]AKU17460.1 cysteine desulfurase [Luteipulveratus mongoliensis]